MTVAVLLLTCDRAEYTRRTLESFSAQNPDARERFVLLHGDDASRDPALNKDLASKHGFKTVVSHQTRRGARALRTALVQAAKTRGADWILMLENDWEWVRPFPWTLFEYLVSKHDVYCLRLFGHYKERNQKCVCSRHHLGKPNRPEVAWRFLSDAPEHVDVAQIHWGCPPSVTRMAEALLLHAAEFKSPAAKQAHLRNLATGRLSSDQPEMLESGLISALTMRVLNPCVYHIGSEKTQSAKPANPSKPARYTQQWQQGRRWTQGGSSRCFEDAIQALGVPGSMLDVGCGEGHLVTRARSLGVDAVGVDLSVSGESGPLRHADLRQPLALGRTFDLVTCWEVAEHLPQESADTICDSLVQHLTPGGVLLFTAAAPGQRGDGHINCEPAAVWRARLEAGGLRFNDAQTASLRKQWTAHATKTPWYGQNLQVFTAEGSEATFRKVELPRVAVTMRTANRSPKPNYVGGTIQRLIENGVEASSIHLCATAPDVSWLKPQLHRAKVKLHIPTRKLTPNENGLEQIRVLDPQAYDWVLLLEDDLEFCADFLISVQRWLMDYARPDRHLYRLFGFRVHPPKSVTGAYDDTCGSRFAGSQAVLLRMADAQDFVTWADANLLTWGGFRGNANIAFDKLLASWSEARWPKVPFVMSHPMFVKHIGKVSSLHPRTSHNDPLFAGYDWAYHAQAVAI